MPTDSNYQNAPQTPRQRYLREWAALDSEYSTWKPRHQDLVDFFQPGRGRFELAQQNKGQRKDEHVVNDTGIDSENKLASAMDTGITSPAREWFRLTTSDPTLNEDTDVRDQLHDWQDVLFQLLGKSNFYQANRNLYLDLIGPATGLMFIEEDPEDRIRFIHCPIGTYRLAVDARGRVCKVIRRFSMTVRQIVEQFCTAPDGSIDLSIVSQRVRSAWEMDQKDSVWIDLLHVVEKRTARQHGKIDAKNKAWASCWLEYSGPESTSNADEMEMGLLKESGYDEQPFVAPRWSVVGEDAYGRGSPGWQSLGDCKALQAMEKGSAKLVAKIIDPPMNHPDALRNASTLPGAKNAIPQNSAVKVEPSVMIPPAAVEVTANEKRVLEHRVQRAHFADLLLVISNDERAQPQTAEEVRAKKEERLLQLGGVFARYADEALKIVINRVLQIAQRLGLIRPPPELASRIDLRVEFENPLVTAQRTIQIASVDRLIAMAANLRAIGRTDALDLLDVDEIMQSSADMLGVKPALLLSPDKVQKLRAQRAQQQATVQNGNAMVQAAPAVKQLSEADPENLQQVLQALGPNAAAQATNGGA